MSHAPLYKVATVERLLGLNPITLRAWRRKGYLEDLGFPPDGKTMLFSVVDLCTFAVTLELIQKFEVAMPLALETAISLRGALAAVMRKDGADFGVIFSGLDEAEEVTAFWSGYAVLKRSSLTGDFEAWTCETLHDVAATLASIGGSGIVLNIGAACQKIGLALINGDD